MKFVWDENKNEENIRKHGIDFMDVPSMFKLPMLVQYDDKKNYGEDRWIGIGLMRFIVVLVIYSEPGSNMIRIISARKATKKERKNYEKKIKDEF